MSDHTPPHDVPRDDARSSDPGEMSTELPRRSALKRLAAASIALPLLTQLSCTPSGPATEGTDATSLRPPMSGSGPRGTLADPDLINPRVTWPMLLTAAEMTTLTALCDLIIPADDKSPGASTVGVPAYVNEYVSAPYPGHQRALVQIRGGLAWLNTESRRRHERGFAELTNAEQTAICDDICYVPRARPEHQAAARFFARVRNLTAEGFYTTDAGMKDIGYVGNTPLPKWDAPPAEVLRHLGLA